MGSVAFRWWLLASAALTVAGCSDRGGPQDPSGGNTGGIGNTSTGGIGNTNTGGAGNPSTGGVAGDTSTGGIAGASSTGGSVGGTGGSVSGDTGGSPAGTGGVGGTIGGKVDPGASVELTESASTAAERKALQSELAKDAGLTTDALIARYAPSAKPAPTFKAADVQGLDKIQASSLALNDAELAALTSRGFAISTRKPFPTFTYGYSTAYFEHLPVYVSADSILFAMHRSYDNILKQFELSLLIQDLKQLLQGMQGRLAAGAASDLSPEAQADADVYLAVASSLLTGAVTAPVARGNAALVRELFDQAQAANGTADLVLFGYQRTLDFSQFKPRGHYTDSVELSRYFRAMIWLGRTDFRLIETKGDGSQIFLRRQFEGAVALRTLLDASLEPIYRQIDDTVTTFVGEHDYMVVEQVSALLSALGVRSPAELAAISDTNIAQTIIDGGYGAQRIASQIMFNVNADGTLPLARSFALLGQRYVIDSEVFSNVVYDRLPTFRMMPNPLDVAFAALGNGQAAALLRPELEHYVYAPNLANMRTLVDAHPNEFWQENLYNLWLSGLRALSPAAGGSDSETLPSTMQSEAWGRRLLNTQLASWAELRHDTILYAKQSYTTGATCEFPDAYVDPYPEFFARVVDYANTGQALLAKLGAASVPALASVTQHFTRLAETAGKLRDMAEHERTGAAFTPEMLAFINQAVQLQPGCGTPFASGWYPNLFYGSSVEFDPTIADVHTQPTDEGGTPVGKVLHVGTGYARSMVVIAEGCSGPRAYIGPVSSYYELITKDYQRLDDIEWSKRVTTGGLAEVEWMQDLVSK
ncbi:MAG TPA: DUF3160 domain-containing protein [Polyangiaceae bacterium]|nr:DUF3160 domain-containing protein [Polyangiaceae bacterium]